MKIAVCCCTFNRPRQLGWMIRCFERQTHVDRQLVILDDAGQYADVQGDRWKLVSVKKRFRSLADKRNACAALIDADVEAIAPWDDDDLYLPWALKAHAAALEKAAWSRPSLVLHPTVWPDGNWSFRQHQTGGLYHAGWAFWLNIFERSGKYPPGWSGPEDRQLMLRLERMKISQADPIALGFKPAYIHTAEVSGSPHISTLLNNGDRGQVAWKRFGMYCIEPAEIVPTDPPSFNLHHAYIEPKIHPRPF
jgi:glycosyltransferase involved in cell wall biosynthesis